MALTVSEAQAVSSYYYDGTLQQTCYDDSPFWVKLKQKNKIKKQGGTLIQFPLRYKKLAQADAVTPTDQVTFEAPDTRTAGQLNWKYYRGRTFITWQERTENVGKPQIVSLLKDKAQEMKDDIYDRFATDVYTSNPNGLGFSSLATIVDSTDSYAGIPVSDASTWAAWEDASTTALALYGAGSLSYYVNIATFGKNGPSMHLTTRNLASKFMSLFEGQKIYEDRELANAGFNNIMFMGGPVVGDYYCPASYWYGLDMDAFEFVTHTDWDFKLVGWQELFQAGHPESMGRVMSWAGNLKCDQRRTNFKLSTPNYTL